MRGFRDVTNMGGRWLMWNPKAAGKSIDCLDHWNKSTSKIDELGPPGLNVVQVRLLVQTLVYRDEEGFLKGVLYHYPQGFAHMKKPGEVELMVHPDSRRQGIGMKLLKEGIRLWDIQAKKQRYNEASARLTDAWLEEYREEKENE